MQDFIDAFKLSISSPKMPHPPGGYDTADINIAVNTQPSDLHTAQTKTTMQATMQATTQVLADTAQDKAAESQSKHEKSSTAVEVNLNAAPERSISVHFERQGYENQVRPTLFRGGSVSAPTSEPITMTTASVNATNVTHKWLDSIDEFATEMRDLWSHILEEQKDQKIKMKEVKVGLIDDGIDLYDHAIFNDKILDGRTFGYTTDGEIAKPWYVSENKHGTIMADMILRVCPMAKIYPLRLDTATQKTEGSIRIMPESGAEVCTLIAYDCQYMASDLYLIPCDTGHLCCDPEGRKHYIHVMDRRPAQRRHAAEEKVR